MCEDVSAIDNLPRILKEVPGIGVVLIGEGDLRRTSATRVSTITPRSSRR